MRFQIQNTKVRIVFSITPQKNGTEVQHEEREISRVGDSFLFDIHEIVQAPILLGIPEIELDFGRPTERFSVLTASFLTFFLFASFAPSTGSGQRLPFELLELDTSAAL